MKILVTGGAGFIGSHLVEALVDCGHEVRILDNLFRGSTEFIEKHLASGRVTFIRGDVRDVQTVQAAMKGVQVVYHLAAQSNVIGAVNDTEYSFTTNVVGTFNVLTCASACGVQRVVFASSREVYGEAKQLPVDEKLPLQAKNEYGASKIAAEAYCRAFAGKGLQTAILRMTNVYGTRDTGRVIPIFVEKALGKQPLTLYGGEQVIDFIWVGHVVSAFMAAGFEVNWPVRQPINVGSGSGTSIKQLAKDILKLTNSPASVNIVPSRAPEVVRFVADTGRLRKLLPYPSRDPLYKLPEVVEYWKGRLGLKPAQIYRKAITKALGIDTPF